MLFRSFSVSRVVWLRLLPLFLCISSCAVASSAEVSRIPRFSVEYMDTTVLPGADFFRYAAGSWLKANPVPEDKSRWSGFEELQERNWQLIHSILDDCQAGRSGKSKPARQVGDFFASAMDTNRIEKLSFDPIQKDLRSIDKLESKDALFRTLAEIHLRDGDALFTPFVNPDAKNSSVYAFHLNQGGLGLPDRDYYLTDAFAVQRAAYQEHIAKMLVLLGETEAEAAEHAATILDLETELAKVSKSRVELRDPIANYHKVAMDELEETAGALPWKPYFRSLGLSKLSELVVRQPTFFTALAGLIQARPLAEWQTYLRWHVLQNSAPFLHGAAENESFRFYGTVLRGQPAQEPRWQRAAKVVDGTIGEALGKLYVEKYFPPAAKQRMEELIGNLRAVFRDRLGKLEWMTDSTREKALTKFDRFTQKIGHPDKFRDYSKVRIRANDYLGNVQRSTEFEVRRQLDRIGKPVDLTEWHMTPQTVNAYFNPLQNEIVFPAGILQPPFFDVEMDDAVNYGAIGVVIGHEITHGYDDQGRKYDADGNLNDWWTEADAKAFDQRAQKVIDQYSGYEALPGLKVNGELTLGENIADLGGTSIAYEALQRALEKDPSKRKTVDGLTPEQRFFLSLAQLWRVNWREAELRRRITVDPHSPAQFRAIGPHVNMQEFFDAFGVNAADPMWRSLDLRAKIW